VVRNDTISYYLLNVLITSSDIDEILAPVPDAAHSRSGPKARCHPGTRENVIMEIIQQIDEHGDKPICWLNGPAGYGKSAIAQAVAERYYAQKRLAASFFFLRGAGDRSTIARVIPTISHQLSIAVPHTKPLIQHVIDHELHITSQSLEYQFQKLVIDPIVASGSSTSFLSGEKPVTWIIVLDALDECDDKDQMVAFIETIIHAFKVNPGLPLQVLITSRVEEHISQKLETRAAHLMVHHLSLQDFSASEDILIFFQSSFATIYEENPRVMQNVLQPWPSKSDLHSLVKKSNGSFIFAATLMGFINNRRGHPQDKLQTALTAEAGLDGLYTQVLSDSPHDHNFDHVLGTVMLLSSPIPVTSLACLLQLRADEDIVQTLLGVQSILMIPGNNDQPIQPFHTSLRDFLILEQHSNQFFINPSTHHFSIANDCLTIITQPPDKDIFYKGGQEYACLNWCYHLNQCLINGEDRILKLVSEVSLMRLLKEFASYSLKFWVNTLLRNGYGNTIEALDLVVVVFKVCNVFHLFWVFNNLNLFPATTKSHTRSIAGFGRY
jgi:hypothetical protein